MNVKQKKFITDKLIPFILREQGNGFAMSTWKTKLTMAPLTKEDLDDLDKLNSWFSFDSCERTKKPMCDTVVCIGGSIQALTRYKAPSKIQRVTGLTPKQQHGLFYNWQGLEEYSWPKSFIERFYIADTPLKKARVAVALLKKVVKTEGACLGPHQLD